MRTLSSVFSSRQSPGNPGRIQSAAMLSDPNNNVVIERQSSGAFDQIRYLIITPDQFMDNAVRQAFTGIGVEDEAVFTEQIHSDMKIGLAAPSLKARED